MVEQRRLVDGAGVVVQPARDRQVDGEVLLRHAEGGEVLHHRRQLIQTLVEDVAAAAVALERGEHLAVAAGDGDELQDLARLLVRQADVLHQTGPDLLRADLVEFIDGAHDVAGLLREPQHRIKAVQDLAVVHADLETLEPEGGERLVNDGGDLGLVRDVKFAVADHVDVGLIELAEAAALGALAAVDLANLIAAEGEGEVVVVQGDVLRQRHRQVKAQREISVSLLEAVDLLLRLAAAFGEQHLAGLDDGGIERGEAIAAVGRAEDVHHPLHLLLRTGQQLHEAGERPGCHFCHIHSPLISCGFLCQIVRRGGKKRSRPAAWDESVSSLRGATQVQPAEGPSCAPVTGSAPWMFPSPLGSCLPTVLPRRARSRWRASLPCGGRCGTPASSSRYFQLFIVWDFSRNVKR